MYTEWWERMKPATLGERFGLKARGPTNVVNKVLEEKPRFQYDPISEELQDVNAPGWAEKATKQMEDIKKSSRKVSVQRTETKSPELSGVDRYILAKKI